MTGLGQKVASGAVWVTLEKCATLSVGFVVSMVLARLLTPSDYGTVALLSIFFAVAGSLASCGFGNALVQKKQAGDLEFNSVFYTSLVVSVVIYVGFFFAAPWIADFYNTPQLTAICRVSALHFILSAINSVQGAELSRKMLFYKRFRISLITCLVSAVCGITFAYLGWGVWALVISSMLTSIASIIAWWAIIAWRPKLMYSFSAVKGLFAYGWKLSVSGLVHTTYMNLYGFLVGKFYTPADLAYVNKGNSMPNLLMSMIDGTILGVSFPALAQLQDDKVRLREAMRRMIKCSTFLVFPLMVGLAVCARPVILLLYGNQWEPAVPYVQLACFGFALYPFNSINTSAISAMGYSGIYLLLECIKKGVGIVVMFLSIRYGVLVLMCAMAFATAPFAVFVNTFANGRLLKYSLLMQLRDVSPSILLSAVMAAAICVVQWGISPFLSHLPRQWMCHVVILALNGIVGVFVYFFLASRLKIGPFYEYVNVALPVLRTRIPFAAKLLERMI